MYMYESQFDTEITLNLKISSKFEHNVNGNNLIRILSHPVVGLYKFSQAMYDTHIQCNC